MSYQIGKSSSTRWLKPLAITLGIILIFALVMVVGGARYLSVNLKSVSSSTQTQEISVTAGMSTNEIAASLYKKGLIRSETAFKWYVTSRNAARYLQAGTYELSPNLTTPEIVSRLTRGKVATELVTIQPGLRLDQIKASLVKQGFSSEEVDAALNPSQYENLPVLASKPKGNNLEGYLYPESFQRTADTKLSSIIEQSLNLMNRNLTPDILQGFKDQELTVYQGITLASIVEKEVVNQEDRAQAAQVFIKRTKINMPLGSDVTAFYASELAGKGQDVTFDSPYNTRIYPGMPPTPISNVSESSLKAVSDPADTDWVFFVSGDDGNTYFSKTVEEHEALTKKYCIELCK